tara:strand:- start:167 stop:439 length:273 start_codon:yes stop_codon:yes gene_type:complete
MTKSNSVNNSKSKFKITIGPSKLTRFERARIIGARSLQLSLGAPVLINQSNTVDPIRLALEELNSKSLPISIRRTLSDGSYQDIPIESLL